MIGIKVRAKIGIGDAIQFTSLPENYFRHFGEKLADLEHHWVFDYNPYVVRNVQKVDEEFDLWNLHCLKQIKADQQGNTTFRSLAESHMRHFGFRFPVVMNRPRLYRFEDYPFFQRKEILLHVKGRSHGQLPDYIVKHVLDKYGDAVTWIGLRDEWEYPFNAPKSIHPSNLWALAERISQCRMFIGVDSGPSWVAQCYPDVITKKVRLIPKKTTDLRHWIPLEWCNLHSHWDDRSAMVYNLSEEDMGFTWTYKKI